jgi:disulfide bond formation protein DsbB
MSTASKALSQQWFDHVLQVFPKYIVFLTALAATLGSLYFSEVQQLAPCMFCWYQRIVMYPIVILMLVGVWRKDTKVYQYIAPLAVIGTLLAGYHYLIQKTDIFGKEFVGCTGGVSCTEVDFQLLGFITIPFLSFMAFVVILLCTYLMHKYGTKFE